MCLCRAIVLHEQSNLQKPGEHSYYSSYEDKGTFAKLGNRHLRQLLEYNQRNVNIYQKMNNQMLYYRGQHTTPRKTT